MNLKPLVVVLAVACVGLLVTGLQTVHERNQTIAKLEIREMEAKLIAVNNRSFDDVVMENGILRDAISKLLEKNRSLERDRATWTTNMAPLDGVLQANHEGVWVYGDSHHDANFESRFPKSFFTP